LQKIHDTEEETDILERIREAMQCAWNNSFSG